MRDREGVSDLAPLSLKKKEPHFIELYIAFSQDIATRGVHGSGTPGTWNWNRSGTGTGTWQRFRRYQPISNFLHFLGRFGVYFALSRGDFSSSHE